MASTAPVEAQPRRPQVYVAMGDSFTAGPLVPMQTGDPPDCGRSDHNYPHLVASAIKAPIFRDVSCTGAQTREFSRPQEAAFGGTNPPQYNALTRSVKLVTVGIGGNDIGFTGIVTECTQPPPPAGRPCSEGFKAGGRDELSRRIRAVAPRIDAALKEIHRRSPKALVLLVSYPALLPDTGVGCYPYVPFLPEDVPYLRAKEKELNGMLAAQARANRATYVDWYAPSIGHDACQIPSVAWVNGWVVAPPSLPGHPNADGFVGSAKAVLRALRSRGFSWSG